VIRKLLAGVAALAVVTLAYYVGRQQSVETPAPAAAAPEPLRQSPGPSPQAMPPGHPPSPDGPVAGGYTGADPDAHFTHFRVGQRNVKALMPDGELMWVGTSAGVIRYDLAKDEYRLFDTRTGLLANGIFHLGRLHGRLAAGTYGGGLALLDEASETWKIYNIPDGLGDGFVYDTLEMPNGDIWVATWSGANRVRGGRLDERGQWDLYTVANTDGGLPNDWVYALRAGKNGAVWFATEGGLARFDDGRWQNWNHQDGLGAAYDVVRAQIEFSTDPAQYSKHHARQKEEMGLQNVDIAYNPNYIVALLVDSDDVVWCGTWGGGLARFDGETWTNYTVADGLPGNHVFMLHEDDSGAMWIGTSNGLARRDNGGGFSVFTTDDGLFSNQVFSMTTAEDGSRWVGSFGGVARIAALD